MSNLEWHAYERTTGEKNPEWYVAVSVIALAIVVTSIIFNNVLLAIIIGIAFVALVISHRRAPEEVSVSIGSRGVRVDDRLYTYENLESFDVDEQKHQLLLKSKKLFSLHIIIPIGNEVSLEEIEHVLLGHLDQEEIQESVFEQFMEYLGF